MAKISKIEPFKPVSKEKKRVAAYARVSRDTEGLLHSLSTQVSYYSKLIQSNPEWSYAGVYADSGITGTSINKREEFKRLMADCDAGKIDIILVKSISRFARNTVDTLEAVRHLKTLGIDVRFERENISSLSSEGELMLTILASYAQEEAESISHNIKWAIKKGFEEGKPHCKPNILGYRWDERNLVIVTEEAKVVRFIFEKYIEGHSPNQISKLLKEKGMVGINGNPMTRASVKDVLKNEVYTGKLVLQKSYSPKIRKKKRNYGELPMYVIEDNHEAIISKEVFEEAERIRIIRGENAPKKEITPFSGKVVCGKCGYKCSRRTQHGYKVWQCNNKETNGACDCKRISEDYLKKAVENTVGEERFKEIILYDDKVEVVPDIGMKLSWERKWWEEVRKRPSYAYSGYLFCGYCGSKLLENKKKDTRSSKARYYKNWICGERKRNKTCKCRAISMNRMDEATMSVLGLKDEEEIKTTFRKKVNKVIVFDDRLEFYLKDEEVVTWQRK